VSNEGVCTFFPALGTDAGGNDAALERVSIDPDRTGTGKAFVEEKVRARRGLGLRQIAAAASPRFRPADGEPQAAPAVAIVPSANGFALE